jgi:hypothetical protein
MNDVPSSKITFLFINQSRSFRPLLPSFVTENKEGLSLLPTLKGKEFRYNISLIKSVVNGGDYALYGVTSTLWCSDETVSPMHNFFSFNQKQLYEIMMSISIPYRLFGLVDCDVLYFKGELDPEGEVDEMVARWRKQIEIDNEEDKNNT